MTLRDYLAYTHIDQSYFDSDCGVNLELLSDSAKRIRCRSVEELLEYGDYLLDDAGFGVHIDKDKSIWFWLL